MGSAGRGVLLTRGPVWVLGAALVLGAGSAWGQAEQSEDDSDSRTHLYSGLVESSELRRSKIRLSRKRWALTAIGSAAGVYDSNAFEGPVAQSVVFGNLALGAMARRNFRDYGRLKIAIAGGAAPHSSYSDVLNEYGVKGKVGYTKKFSDDLSARLFGIVKYSNDHATNINGNAFFRDFENVSYRFGSSASYEVGDYGDVRLGYDGKRKDYTETALLRSLDWWRHRMSARYRVPVGSSAHLDLEYRFAIQQYDEESSQFSSGIPDPTTEEHFFHRVEMDGSWEVTSWAEVGGGYRFKRKDDRFDDYESYDSHKLELVTELAATTRMAIELGTSVELRRFDNRPGSLLGGTILEYNKYIFFTNGIFSFTKHLAGWVGYKFVDRESNRSFGTSYRSYVEHQIFMGVTAAY